MALGIFNFDRTRLKCGEVCGLNPSLVYVFIRQNYRNNILIIFMQYDTLTFDSQCKRNAADSFS